MNRIIITVFSILIYFVSYSQQIDIQIKVTDSKTNEPLPFATVYLKNTGKGTTTNFDGQSQINLEKRILNSDTLICSYIGYENKEIPVNLTKPIKLNILLKATTALLSEVIVTGKKLLTSKQILRKSLKNTSQNYSDIPVNIAGLYRETIKEDNRYIQLNEAFVNFYYTKYPQNFDRKIWLDWYYNDTYAFEFEFCLFSEFPQHFNTKKDQVKIIEGRTSENLSNYSSETSISGGALGLTALDLMKYQCDFLDSDNLNKYNYVKKENEFINNHNCYVLHFYPNEINRKMIFCMSRKLNRSIYVGKLYIDIETFAVVKMEYQLAKNVDFGFYTPRIPLDYRVIVDYQKDNDTWFLHKINLTRIRAYNNKYWTYKPIIYEGVQELIITRIKKDSVARFLENETWKHTKLTTLRFHKLPYNHEFWQEYEKDDYPVLSKSIKHDLEAEKTLDLQFAERFKQKKYLSVPRASKVEFSFNYPFENLKDNYQWLANPEYQTDIYDYLKTENEYAKNYIIPYRNYQKNFFNSLNNFYPKDTSNSDQIHKKGDYEIDNNSLENTLLYEYTDSIIKIPIFNYTSFQDNRKNCFITSLKPTEKQIGITFTDNGGLDNYLIVLNKGSQKVKDSIADVNSYQWFNDSVLFYTKNNLSKRSDKLFYHNHKTKKDSLIILEEDSTYDISLSQSGNYIICTIESKDESEIYLIKKGSNIPKLELLKERQTGITYSVKEYDNQIFILTNEDAINNKLCVLSSDIIESKDWKELVSHQKNILIDDFIITNNFIVLKTYKNSFPEIIYRLKEDNKWKKIDFNSKIYDADIRLLNKDKIKIYYSNPGTPFIQYRFDLQNEVFTEIKKTKIKRGFNTRYFKMERIWAKSVDGTKIPITLTKSLHPKKKHKGLILKVYGAYGAITGGYFNAEDAILLNDGYTIAYAHVRGERLMGNQWYLDGKLLNKENSFNDYIACAEHLIKKKYTTVEQLIGYGNSAGGLIMGVVINRRPELFNTIILDHPYLDVLSTMMNDSLPLTTDEYKEWGNPNEKEVYNYIKAYSPYQNIKKQKHPNLLFTASWNDFQTPVWQVAKYVAKLKEYNTGDNSILFTTDLGSGHIGNTSGKEWMKNLSFQYTYIYGNIFE